MTISSQTSPGTLKSITLRNFKSYRGEITIGPFRNFTCIIGPNGSGKSNIMDAISFVLGLKSNALRSSQLKELIYRSGQLEEFEPSQVQPEYVTNDCSVALLYETNTGTEIEFSRAITSSGASEYRLNGKTTSWAAYNEQLEGQNILVKARNFLVFQGDVEQIASQSSKDLTKLIEQISGSIEYAAEYESLKNQLNDLTTTSTVNFHKKKTIASEMRAYKLQKSEADQFSKLQDDREALELQRILWKLYHISKNMENGEKDIKAMSAQVTEQAALIKQSEAEIKESKKRQAGGLKEAARLDKSLKTKLREKEDRAPDNIALIEQVGHTSSKIQKTRATITKLETTRDKHKKAISELEKQQADVRDAAKVLEDHQKQSAEVQGLTLTKAQADKYAQLKNEVISKTAKQTVALNSAQRKLTNLIDAKGRQQTDMDEYTRKRTSLTTTIQDLEDRKSNYTSSLAEIEKDLEIAAEQLATNQRKRNAIQQNESELQEKLNTTLNQLMNARVDANTTAKERQAAQTLTSLKQLMHGVHGRLIDLCRPVHKKYETAIGIVLGRHKGSIVVDDAKVARECIQYLKDQRCEPFTFLPLSTLNYKPISERLRTAHKQAKLAVDVIEFEDIVQNAMYFACENSMVVESLDVARYLNYDCQLHLKAVTVDGTVIHKGGNITGGGANLGSKVAKWDEKEVDNLKRAKVNLEEALATLAEEIRNLPTLVTLQAQKSSLESRLAFTAEELSATSQKLAAANTELDIVSKQIKALSPALQQIGEEVQAATEEYERYQKEIADAEDLIFADFCRKIGLANIREYEKRESSLNEQYNTQKLAYEKQIALIQAQLMLEQEHLKDSVERLNKLSALMAKDISTHQTLEVKQKEQQSINDELDAQIRSIKEKMSEHHKTMLDIKADSDRLKANHSAAIKAGDDLDKQIAGREALIEKLEHEKYVILRKCKLEKIPLPLSKGTLQELPMEDGVTLTSQPANDSDMDIDEPSQTISQTQRAAAKIVPNYRMLPQAMKDDSSDAISNDLHNRIEDITSEIEKMTPNLRANEKLDEVELKLRKTVDEFEESRKEAKTAREQFNEVRRNRSNAFMKAFTHIEQAIDPIYKELTKMPNFPQGGSAYLSIENSEEPYLEGIKFNTMPPLKRFRDMDQLSGGEKTVAALALLFAIHSYFPSPFFVLDEVDAALDPMNVASVAQYLRRHCGVDTQFVVISLKSVLYEKAEALIGIYRDHEKISSRCLTLNLDDYED